MKKPLTIEYRFDSDTVTIDGRQYAGDFFRFFAEPDPGKFFRVVAMEDTVMVQQAGEEPPDVITARAVKALAEWALKEMPPLAIIGACDRALWWADRAIAEQEGKR
jgi:hypothetical protein